MELLDYIVILLLTFFGGTTILLPTGAVPFCITTGSAQEGLISPHLCPNSFFSFFFLIVGILMVVRWWSSDFQITQGIPVSDLG